MALPGPDRAAGVRDGRLRRGVLVEFGRSVGRRRAEQQSFRSPGSDADADSSGGVGVRNQSDR
jgi:hypothetical protein